MRIARLALPALLSTVAFWAAPAAAATLVPHRAVYDLALDEASDRSGINGISGRMVYEFNGSACDGYTVTFRFVTRIDTDEVSRLTDQQTTTFEEGSGDSFTFVTRSFIDQSLQKELKGTARLSPSATLVSLEKPANEEMTLEETQFPTQHLLELLQKAQQGETFYETSLFDGSEDGDKVMTTTVVIGRQSTLAADDPEHDLLAAVGEASYWPVNIAYFDLQNGDATGEGMPTYRIAFKLNETGVTHDLVMDYGDFAIAGQLVELEAFDRVEDCR